MSTLRLLGRSSSINVRKVLWTLGEIGVAFTHEGDWATPARPATLPEFLALNPNAMVPVMIDENGPLWESNNICRYLAAKHGRNDLLPAAAAKRAAVEQWMDWQATDLNSAWRYAFLALVRKSPSHAKADEISASIKRWNELMTILARRLDQTGAFVAGAEFTLADVVLGVSAHRWLLTPMDRPDLSHVATWYAALRARPAAAIALSHDFP